MDWEGQPTYGLFELGKLPASLRITFESSVERPVQGLHFKARKASLDVEGQRLTNVLLWTDTAPHEVLINVIAAGKGPSLRFWNVWHYGDNSPQAWLGNSGMLVEERGSDTLLVGCSDGEGDVDFTNLRVRIELLGTLGHGDVVLGG